MKRSRIISTIGEKYLTSNIENEEFSYKKALSKIGKNVEDYQENSSGRVYQFIDLRFSNDKISILVETKDDFSKWNNEELIKQIQTYINCEKELSNNKIIAILANTNDDRIKVWYGDDLRISFENNIDDERKIKSFDEYENIYFGTKNDKLKVIQNTYNLNELLHKYGIKEKIRSQFVGTCLLALKNGLVYNNLTTSQVIAGVREKLEKLLNDNINKAEKLVLLDKNVLSSQDVRELTNEQMAEILTSIEKDILPYINDQSTQGQDLLNLFFTTFNKYVGKSDKNQAFTPDHICDFMSKAVGVNRNSRVLDPCCGSGAFLVRAMTDAMDDCDTEQDRENVKKNQIYGIEYEEGAYGLSSTNMLIHGDGNSNVVKDSMFNKGSWIEDADINIVLMNPPYNASKKQCNPEYVKTWSSKKKEDPSKGFHYVEWVARHVSHNCKMAVLLPMQAAIGNSRDVKDFKEKMLEDYTLDAVFSLPNEIFYPGASAVACCMIFDLSQRHERANRETFFGYYKDDGFAKRKGVGRVEQTDAEGNSLWEPIKQKWLDLYRNRKEVPGLSVMKKVTYNDEWLAEAYMQADYSTLSNNDFKTTINNYLSYLVGEGKYNEA